MSSSTLQGHAPIPGGSLYYEITGEGEPIVLVHGFSLDRRMWDAQVPALSRHHRVIRYDLRGFGRSPYPEGPYTHAEDLHHLLTHLAIDQAVLVGLSLGGGAVLNFALLYPERVRALVLVDSTLGGFAWSADFAELSARLQALAQEEGVEAAKACWLSCLLFAPALRKPEVADALRSMVQDYSGLHWLRRDPGRPLSPPAAERLTQIGAPTLVVAGELDTDDFQGIAAQLERGIPGARKVVIPAAGHMASMEAPEQFNALVLEFLAELPTQAARAPGSRS